MNPPPGTPTLLMAEGPRTGEEIEKDNEPANGIPPATKSWAVLVLALQIPYAAHF